MRKNTMVELVYCPTCPTLPATRKVLLQAIDEFGKERIRFSEIDVHARDNLAKHKNWPSPSILIDGVEFEGIKQDPDQPCRLFEGEKEFPDKTKLLIALEKVTESV